MQTCTSVLRVRYAEVDRLGAVNSARYFEWFELGRSDLLRQAGLPYDSMEARGVALPVIEACCRYVAKLGYDEVIRVETSLEVLSPLKLKFSFKVFRDDGNGKETLAAEGHTVNAAVNGEGKPARLPQEVVAALSRSS